MSGFYYTFTEEGMVTIAVAKITFIDLRPKTGAVVFFGGGTSGPLTIPLPAGFDLYRMWINDEAAYEQLMKVYTERYG